MPRHFREKMCHEQCVPDNSSEVNLQLIISLSYILVYMYNIYESCKHLSVQSCHGLYFYILPQFLWQSSTRNKLTTNKENKQENMEKLCCLPEMWQVGNDHQNCLKVENIFHDGLKYNHFLKMVLCNCFTQCLLDMASFLS